jgi:polysaccharide biosynthesis transport protein
MSAHAAVFESLPAGSPGHTSLSERLAALRRRSRPALIVLVSMLALTLLLALLWPPTYRSSGTVLIEQQEVPKEYVRAAITSFADQRVRTTSQRVMTTANLLEIVRRYDLYPEMRRREPREKLLERMRDDIGLAMISADVVDPAQGRPTKATIAFTVSFDHRSPLIAAKVANELTTLYMNENLQTRRQSAAGTADFLRVEADRVGAEVTDLERRIAEFKTDHGDALPELGQVNIQLMARTDEELRSAQARVNSLDQQIVYLEGQLALIDPVGGSYGENGMRVLSTPQRLKALRTQLASATALYGPTHPDVVRLKREVSGLEREVGDTQSANDLVRQLNDAKSQLAQARTRYSPNHPDVQRLERIVAAIDAAMRQSSATSSSLEVIEKPDNPAYVEIKAQREGALNERASLRAQIAELRARGNDFESRLARAPAVEREYSALLREMEGAQLKYQEVRQKQMEAQLASNLEVEQKGERFTLIDPPLVPEEPVSPNVPLVFTLGVLLALASSFGLAMLLEQTDDSVRSRRDLESLLTVPPLAVVPRIDTDTDHALRRRNRQRWLGACIGGIVGLLLLMHFLWRPLDVVWQVLLRRLGL